MFVCTPAALSKGQISAMPVHRWLVSMTVLGGLGGLRRIVAPTDSHVARCEVIRVSRRERHEWDTLVGRTAAESSSRALRYS